MKIVLAYSGGLDTSVLLSWIKEKYNAEMIAFCANIGQEDELTGLEAKARKTGASNIYIDDLQEEFARDFIYPIIHAGAIYEGQYFLGTSIARPLIARRMVEIARKEKADAIAHGATGKGNDQVRFELTAAALAPDLQVIAPWRDARFRNEFPGRQEMIDYCVRHKIPVKASARKPFSSDRTSCTFPTKPAFSKTRGWTPATKSSAARSPRSRCSPKTRLTNRSSSRSISSRAIASPSTARNFPRLA